MLFRVNNRTFIRDYNDIGYICNIDTNNDLVFDSVGKVFLLALSKDKCLTLQSICSQIAKNIEVVNYETLKNDVEEFLFLLEKEGFITSGKSYDEINLKEIQQRKKIQEGKTVVNNYIPLIKQNLPSTKLFLKQFFEKNPHILSVQIEVTNVCNERCIHCYIPHELKTTHMDIQLYRDILMQCREMGVLTILLTGGEPMLHPQFVEFIKLISEFDFEIKILSNLTALNDNIINALKNSKCSGIQVSLYSMNPQIHDSITKKQGSFSSTINAIHKLLNANIPVQLGCVVMKANKNCYKEVIKWANNLGMTTTIDYILMGRCDFTTSNLQHRLTLEEVETIIRDIIDFDESYRQKIIDADLDFMNEIVNKTDLVCNVCRTTIGVSANGNVYPCVGWQGNILGNLVSQNLMDIWNNSPKVCSLRKIRKSDFDDCKKCENKIFCSMCLVRNANEHNGNYLKLNKHTCDIAALNKKIILEYKCSQK